jgi:hypothetical protein
LTGLTANTLYYVRAYATNSEGTGYGNAVSFTSNPIIPPTVTTGTTMATSTTTAISGGNVISDGGAAVTSRGVCWSTSANPTIANSKTSDGTGTGIFTSNIAGLTANISYHVRAYATNSAGTNYGLDVLFSTPPYPTNGLISYFNFDNNLKDQLGNTPDGANYGGATFTSGKAGSAITFNGTNQYIQFGRKTYQNGNNVSVAFWFVKPNTTEGLKFFINCNDFSVATNGASASFVISVPYTNNASGTIAQNAWIHFVGTYDGTNIKVYINSVLANTTNWPGSLDVYGNNYLTLGYDSGTSYWNGMIDDLFIYNRVLTQTEVNQLFYYH